MIDSIKQLLQQEAQAVLNIPITDAYEKAVKLIVEQIHQKKGKLVTSGMGKAGQIAMNIATTFCSTGIPSVFLHPSEAQHGDLGIYEPIPACLSRHLFAQQHLDDQHLDTSALAAHHHRPALSGVLPAQQRHFHWQFCRLTQCGCSIAPYGQKPLHPVFGHGIRHHRLACLVVFTPNQRPKKALKHSYQLNKLTI